MLFIFLHINILVVFVKSHLKTDCYVSFSNPPIYIKISHYYPSGPIYLYASFITFRHSNIAAIRTEYYHLDLHFKRFDNKCTPSVLFSTRGSDFKYLYASIFLRLHQKGDIFAGFSYNFFRGFKPGIYQMFDKHQNFLLHSQIRDFVKNYLKVPVSLTKDAEFYLNSIAGKNSELCVITENNHVVILHPNYADIVPYGFIKLFSADIYHNGELIGRRDYPAFECNKNRTDSEEAIMFIIDGKNYQVNLYVIDIFLKKKKLDLSNKKINYIKNLKNIHTNYKQIFLMIHKIDYTECPDRSRAMFYLSNDNITYYVKVYQKVYISSWVKFSGEFYRSPFNICGSNI